MFGWGRKMQEIAGDGLPVRNGITYTEDQRRVLDMLCLCGELGGVGPQEPYSSYLRRLIDRLIELERQGSECRNEGRMVEQATDPTNWTDQERSFYAAGFNDHVKHAYSSSTSETKR